LNDRLIDCSKGALLGGFNCQVTKQHPSAPVNISLQMQLNTNAKAHHNQVLYIK